MSFHEMAITIRAVNRASREFDRIGSDAETMGTKVEASGAKMSAGLAQVGVQAELSAAQIRAFSAQLAGIGALGVGVAHVAHQFGVLNDEQTRTVSSVMSVVAVMGMFMRTSWGVAVAQKVYSAACWVATTAQNAFNISFAAGLALTGVGIGVIIAAAAAVAYFASQMKRATSSVRDYNATVAEAPSYTRSIRRAGEEEELRRRGIE